jgi:hypothetical protein
MNVVAESAPETRPPSVAPRSLRSVLAPLALVLTVAYGYWAAFSTFSEYDDEGYMMLTIRHMLDGRKLYDEVPTLYGPFYYAVRLLIHGGLGVPLTSDSARWTTLIFWTATAGLAALATWRWTHRVAPLVIAYTSTFITLSTLVKEPVHPQELCALLVAVMLAVLSWEGGVQRAAGVAAGLGAAAACLVLTKVNIGVFATISLLLALMAASQGRLARAAFVGLTLAAIGIPFVIIRHDLFTARSSCFASIVALSVLAFAIVGSTSERPLAERPVRSLAFFAAGAALASILPVLVIGFRGTTLLGLFQGVLLAPLRFGSMNDVWYGEPAEGPGVLTAAISVGLAMLYYGRSGRSGPRPAFDRAFVFLKIGYGAFCLTCAFLPHKNLLLNFGTPFVWLILVQPRDEDVRAAFPRLALGFLAILQVLQAYPVAGSQISVGTFLNATIATLCLTDAVRSLEGRLAWGSLPGRLARSTLPLFSGAVLLVGAWMAERSHRQYGRKQPIPPFAGRGAKLLRFDEKKAATFQWLVANLTRYGDTFQSNVGLNSLYFWSGLEPPTSIVVGNVLDFCSDQEQRAIVRALEAAPKACAVEGSAIWPPRRPSPLLDEMEQAFENRGTVSGYQFRVRRGREIPFMVDCASWTGDGGDRSGRTATASVVVTPLPGRKIHGLCVYNVDRQVVVAQTGPAGTTPALDIRDERSPLALPLAFPGSEGTDVRPPLRLWLSLPRASLERYVGFLVVRLLGSEGEVLESLPFVPHP